MSTKGTTFKQYTPEEHAEYGNRIRAYLKSLSKGTAVTAKQINAACDFPRGNTAKDVIWKLVETGEVYRFEAVVDKCMRNKVVYMLAGRYQVR